MRYAGALLGLCLAVNLFAGQSKPLQVEPGQIFNIALEPPPGKGFEWQLAKPLNLKVVKLMGVDYIQAGSDRTNTPALELWKFKAVAPGQANVALKCSRPWQPSVPPVRSTNFVVVVIQPKPKPAAR